MGHEEGIVEIKSLRKIYSRPWAQGYEALKSIDLKVEEGEIFGFLGPNGAGKTTTIKILAGLIYPTAGSVRILGKSLEDYTYRKYMGYLPERLRFYENLTGQEFLGYCAKLLGLTSSDARKKSGELLELMGLREWARSPIKTYSQGMTQKLGLAQALLGDPRLLILDEPMSALDPLGRRQVRDLLLELKRKGKTIFFSSHILYDVEMFCDRVVMLKSGEVILEMDIKSLLDKSILGYEIVAANINTRTQELLKQSGISCNDRLGHTHILTDSTKKTKVLDLLYLSHTEIISVLPQKQSLEDIFIERLGQGKAQKL